MATTDYGMYVSGSDYSQYGLYYGGPNLTVANPYIYIGNTIADAEPESFKDKLISEIDSWLKGALDI